MTPVQKLCIGWGAAASMVVAGIMATMEIRENIEGGTDCYKQAAEWKLDVDVGPAIREMSADGFMSASECSSLPYRIANAAEEREFRQAKAALL